MAKKTTRTGARRVFAGRVISAPTRASIVGSSATGLLALALTLGSVHAQTQIPAPQPEVQQAPAASPGLEQQQQQQQQSGEPAASQTPAAQQTDTAKPAEIGQQKDLVPGPGVELAQQPGQTQRTEEGSFTGLAPSGIAYATGGVSQEQVRELKQMSQKFSLQLTTAARESGAYIAGVDLSIKDRNGKPVFDAQELYGPLLMVDLPEGTYTVEAKLGDQVQRRQVRVSPNSRRNMVLYFSSAAKLERQLPQ